MLKFKSLSVENFLSIGKDPIEVSFIEGLSIITGTNKDKDDRSNGTGKSSSMEALYFGITGKTLRGLNKADIVNKKTKKGTKVTVEFSKGPTEYKIVRGIKPSILTVYVNGKDVSRDSISNTQSEIDNVIGINEDVIKNSVIMGINQTIPFMAQTKVEKRKFIEGIFDMTMFSDMLKMCRKDYNEIAKELTALTSQTEEKERNFDTYKEQESKFEESKKSRLSDVSERIGELDTGLSKLLEEYSEVDLSDDKTVCEDSIKDCRLKSEKFRDKKTEIVTVNNRFSSEISAIPSKIEEAKKATTCPKCNRPYDDHDEDHLRDRIRELEEQVPKYMAKIAKNEAAITKIQTGIDKFNDQIKSKELSLREIQAKIMENKVLATRIEDYKRDIDQLNKDKQKIEDEKNELSDIVKKIEGEIGENRKNIGIKETDVQVLDQIKFILGENGVKSFIINKMLDIFNNRINVYLDKLNANCVLKFDEFFEEKIINDKNHECSYFNFSSGERRNIDIAIMFAFMDIQKLQGKFDCNIMVFDELIDGSLDEEGVGFVLDILLDKCKVDGRCVYLITHRKEAAQYATGDLIQIEKQNGISRRV